MPDPSRENIDKTPAVVLTGSGRAPNQFVAKIRVAETEQGDGRAPVGRRIDTSRCTDDIYIG